MHAVAVSDLHGNLRLYELLLRIAETWRISSVFIAGDLGPPGGLRSIDPAGAAEIITRQRDFYRRELIPLMESFFHGHRHTHVYAILGNDDCAANEELLLQFDRDCANFHLVNGRVVPLRESHQMHSMFPDEIPLLHVAGYPFVPPGAGLLMDWVKFENRLELRPPDIDPCADLSTSGLRTAGDGEPSTTIADDLADFRKFLDSPSEEPVDYAPERTIHLFHSPPYNTPLDWVPPAGRYEFLSLPDHVGSIEIRRFIERTQPYLVLSGHCHESVVLGDYKTTIGTTVCVNPGSQTHLDVLSLVQFDVYRPSRMKQFFIHAD